MPAKLARLRNNSLADIAIDKEPRTVLGQPFQRLGKAVIAEGFARLHELAVCCEDRAGAFALSQDWRDDREEVGLKTVQRKTLARGAGGGLHQALHRQARVSLVHGEQALRDTGRGRGPKADMKLLGGGAEIGLNGKERNLVRRPAAQRRLHEEVEQLDRVAAGLARHEKPAAAGRSEYGLGDEAHAYARDRRIEGVAAIGQNLAGSRGGQRMTGRDDTLCLRHGDVPKAR